MSEHEIKWRLPEVWTVVRSDGRQIRIAVVQDGNTLTGTTQGGQDDGIGTLTGMLAGSVDGDTITLTIYWPDRSIAEYSGTVDGAGQAKGTTVNQSDSASVTDWFGEPALSEWE